MKARLPQGYGGGGAANLQQIARQAQKIQEQMDAATAELEATEYSATAGGDAVKAVATARWRSSLWKSSPRSWTPRISKCSAIW